MVPPGPTAPPTRAMRKSTCTTKSNLMKDVQLQRLIRQLQKLVKTLPSFVIDFIHYCYVPTLPIKPSVSSVRLIQVCRQNNVCLIESQSEWPTPTILMLSEEPISTPSKCSVSIG